MIYAQINYPQTQGINGKYPIHDVGCFITSFANLLSERYAYNITPLDINNKFVANNLFIDVDDGVRDDVDWNFISFITPTVSAVSIYRDHKDSAGNYVRPEVPNNNQVIVKFAYTSPRTNQFSTHFCLYDGDGYIIDSWDGVRKAISSTWYGAPVGYAVYASTVPQSVVPSPQNNAPAYVGKPGVVVLPASVSTWRAYKRGSGLRPDTDDQVGLLEPAKYGGLRYDINGWVGDYAVEITTQAFGPVTIWVKDTDAQFTEVPTEPPKPEPTPVPAPKPVYERLSTEVRVRTKPGVRLWELSYTDFADAEANHIVSVLNDPIIFTAVGKATRSDMPGAPVYYMSNESFGNADTTGTPDHNQGVNTVDLEPAPPEVEQPVLSPALTNPIDGEPIEVKIAPPNPEAWKTSYKTNDSGDYVAKASVVVHDLAEVETDMQLVKGQLVHVAGTFTGPDGIKYYRTVKGVQENNWRGVPLECLIEDDSIFTYKDDLIDDFKEITHRLSGKEKAIVAAAKMHGNVNWLAERLKKKG